MKCLKFTSERGNGWSGNRPLFTWIFLRNEWRSTLKVGLQFAQIGRANERPDIPLVEIVVNVNSRQFQPMECPVAHSRDQFARPIRVNCKPTFKSSSESKNFLRTLSFSPNLLVLIYKKVFRCWDLDLVKHEPRGLLMFVKQLQFNGLSLDDWLVWICLRYYITFCQ